MKKILKILIISMTMLILAGCDNGDRDGQDEPNDGFKQEDTSEKVDNADDSTVETSGEAYSGYSFKYNDADIIMNAEADPIIEKLGEAAEYFEAESCAFQGLDKTYYYNGFEVTTYPMEEEDYISSIYFVDDSVGTDEGIYIGSSMDEVISIYGEDYQEEGTSLVYTKDDSNLAFIIEDEVVVSITYNAIID